MARVSARSEAAGEGEDTLTPAGWRAFYRMILKSGTRFSEKIMRQQNVRGVDPPAGTLSSGNR
jgi:hypothetical protein